MFRCGFQIVNATKQGRAIRALALGTFGFGPSRAIFSNRDLFRAGIVSIGVSYAYLCAAGESVELQHMDGKQRVASGKHLLWLRHGDVESRDIHFTYLQQGWRSQN